MFDVLLQGAHVLAWQNGSRRQGSDTRFVGVVGVDGRRRDHGDRTCAHVINAMMGRSRTTATANTAGA